MTSLKTSKVTGLKVQELHTTRERAKSAKYIVFYFKKTPANETFDLRKVQKIPPCPLKWKRKYNQLSRMWDVEAAEAPCLDSRAARIVTVNRRGTGTAGDNWED